MERVILHCDLNSFYASVEELYNPELRGHPIAVGGDKDERHGIILARNQLAKKCGVVAAEPTWQAKNKCPDLILVEPHYERYQLYSTRVRKIFLEYTDCVEPFGLDEAWLDVTHSSYFGTGQQIADQIRERVYNELGVTVSVGVSFNKIFAKLGSDLRKPNYTTVISKENYKKIVWPLKADEMIYVGKSTYMVLQQMGIKTIGDLANTDVSILERVFGKAGPMLWKNANGLDDSEVAQFDYVEDPKSISHCVTHFRNLVSKQDLEIVLYSLSDSLATSLKKQGFKCGEITLTFRDENLEVITRQMKLTNPTNLSCEIMEAARKLYQAHWHFNKPLRTIGIRVSKLSKGEHDMTQLSLFENYVNREVDEKLERAVDDIRSRYGKKSVRRLSMLLDPKLTNFEEDNNHDDLLNWKG